MVLLLVQGGDRLYFKVLWLLHFFVGCVSFHIHFFFFLFFWLSFPRAPSYLPLETALIKKKKKIKTQSTLPGMLSRERPRLLSNLFGEK